MTPRRRVIAALGIVAVLVASVLVLRATDDASKKPSSEAVRLTKYTADFVEVSPQPARPSPPSTVWSSDGRVQWAPVDGAAGYEVAGKLVASPEAAGSGRPEVRAVDAFGQRSQPVKAEERPSDDSWRQKINGWIDDFDDTFLERRYHLSGRRGCVNPGSGSGGRLVLDMPCGNDTAVLRARSLLQLNESGELGRVAVVTDAAGPRGKLVLDLVPGTPDRLGPIPPPDAIRVVVDDSVAPGTRGAGVLHRFEAVLTDNDVRVVQDGVQIATVPGPPKWREASVLISVTPPPSYPGRVEIDAVGITGSRGPADEVIETPLVAGTLRVLEPDEEAPSVGVARAPLRAAPSARLRTTVRFGDGGDPNGLVAELGPAKLPLRPVVSGWSAAEDSELTLAGDVPAELLGEAGPHALTPFVLRMPGASQAQVLESYLEVPGRSPVKLENAPDEPPPVLPVMTAEFAATGPNDTTLVVTLDASSARSVAPIAGFEVYVDSSLAATVPMPGGIGGRHELLLSLKGSHHVEVRLRPEDPGRQTDSVWLELRR
ncbi:hypothetical protein [Lentzea albidocapillata]|uniref:Uncharacterized protein n=1 Tax=Lentzea albidocapillata TaxID=40571 RepID=A0A1W2EQC2_9PSEU|nr:hypothetical protein [Lentzea albidocapillata]SMD11907.1 hypothetical protein SAMN05660733_04339 [Lentzea albidocapillata]